MCWQLDCDAIVLEDEFTSGPITWMHAGRAVIFTTAADVADSDGDILAALDKKMAEHPEAKALLLSSVSYMDGHALDMERAGSLCRARGVDLVVDAAQSLGALPIDVRAAHVSFLCAPSYKWLCSGPGLGVLFVSQAVLDRAGPGCAPTAGWFSQLREGVADRNYELRPHADARQFHYGTPTFFVGGLP